jgi:hypothetical protein
LPQGLRYAILGSGMFLIAILLAPGAEANHAGVTCRGVAVTQHAYAGTSGDDVIIGTDTASIEVFNGKGGNDTRRPRLHLR